MNKMEFNTLWTALAGTCIAMVYIFTTFASAADVEEVKAKITRVEVRILKAGIRDTRRLIRENPDDQGLKDDLVEMLDELCLIVPNDRECK